LGDWLNEEEFESVGFGVTGPRERREAAKSGSRASRSTAWVRVDATGLEESEGWTVGPCGWGCAWGGGALVVVEVGIRVGYFRVEALAAERAALEDAPPIVI